MPLRPAAEAVLEALEGRRWPLYFIAPTGYGKTRLVLEAVERLYPGVPGFVHALPLRAIIEQVYLRASRELSVPVGYQAGGLLLHGKSPFMAAAYNVVTYDSLLYNLYRVNVAEQSLGHYEVPRAHILSSLVVLDEAHLGLGHLAGSLLDAARYLHESRTPLLVETATMPPSLFEKLLEEVEGRVVIPAPRGGFNGDCLRLLAPGASVEQVEDPDYYEAYEGLSWRFEPVDEERVASLVAAEAESGLRVLVVARGPREAVSLYHRLREALGEGVALLHGRLAAVDRRGVVAGLEEGRVSVLVGTSAVEAGIDIDFDALYTSVDGPADSRSALIQRMGRIARSPERVGELREARVYLYGEGAEAEARAWMGVDPRLPCDAGGGRRGYARLLAGEEAELEQSTRLEERLRESLLTHPDIGPGGLDRLLRVAESLVCDVVRGEALVSLVAAELLGCSGCRCSPTPAEVAEASLAVRLGELPRLLSRNPPRLIVVDGKVCAVAVGDGGLEARPAVPAWLVEGLGGSGWRRACARLLRALREKRVVALVAEGYRRGEGLV